MPNRKPLKILIVGSSVAGPALATLLLLSPLNPKPEITILEKRSPSSFKTQSGQNIDIRGSGMTIIRKLGLEKAVTDSTTGEVGVQFVDDQNRVWAQNGAGPNSGTSDVEIMRGKLAEILYERCMSVGEEVERKGEGKAVEFLFGDTMEELEQDGEKVIVKLKKSGETREFDLVVGADGLQSSTRKLVWGEKGDEERVKRLGMYGAFFSMPKGGNDTLWRRWFHAPGRRGIMVRPDVQRNRTTVFMYVINEQDPRLKEIAKKGHEEIDAQKELMAEYFSDVGWESERIIREMKATKDFYYDMVAQVKMKKWTKGRVALVGDAGYCPSPISGMGTTLALNGAYHLAGAISRNSNDCPAALAAYEEQMRDLVDRAQKLPPGAPNIINPETAWGIFVMRAIIGFIAWTRIVSFLSYFTSWEQKYFPVEEYGFRELPESPA